MTIQSRGICWLIHLYMIFYLKSVTGFSFIDDSNTISRCDGSYKIGKRIFVNFKKMNQPCDCTLRAFFSGYLLVTAKSDGYHDCGNDVTVSLDTTTIAFKCDSTYPSAIPFIVVNNETIVHVTAKYTYTVGGLPICLEINQNGTVYIY